MKHENLIITPETGSRYMSDAMINTEAWLNKIGTLISREDEAEWDNDLEVLLSINREHNEPDHRDAEDAELVSFRSRDNVYNHENDFDTIFTFSIYTHGEGSDYIWHDTAYVAVCLHRGGDARGNYGAVKVYKLNSSLGDSGFFDWCIGWRVEDATTGEDIDPDGRYGIGYSSNPTYHLESEFRDETEEEPRQWEDGSFVAVLDTKNSEIPSVKVKCTPYLNIY